MKALHLFLELNLSLLAFWMQSRNTDMISTTSLGCCPGRGCCTEQLSESKSHPLLDGSFPNLLSHEQGKELCRSQGKCYFEEVLCFLRNMQPCREVFSLFLFFSFFIFFPLSKNSSYLKNVSCTGLVAFPLHLLQKRTLEREKNS